MVSGGLAPTDAGLRTRLSEGQWAALVSATGLEGGDHALRPLPDADGTSEEFDDALVEAARVAVGPAPVAVELVSGADDPAPGGVALRLGTDLVSTGIAVRRLVRPADRAGPRPVPGVELSANRAGNVLGEVLRAFPPGGEQRDLDDIPVALPAETALTLVRALESGDDDLVDDTSELCGLDGPPELLVSLAAGASATVTMTTHLAGHAEVRVDQWLLAGVGWVHLTVSGGQVRHRVRSRREVAQDLTYTFAGVMDAAAQRGEADDG